MAFTTYYIPSSGQPRCSVESHDSLASALAAWEANCGGLLACSGGRSALEDCGQDALTWRETADGAYATGVLAVVGDDYHEVARRIREREAIEA